MIPCFLIEEHHEAFYIWHQAITNKVIDPRNNLLLHIDEHADLGIPQLNTSLKQIANIKEFVYRELSIMNFIYPAFYQKIFNQMYWLRSTHESHLTPRKLYISSEHHDGKTLKIASEISMSNWWNPDRHCVNFIPTIPTDRNLNLKQSIVLDIDLDYFSCDNRNGAYFEVEITADAYYNLRDNYYNKPKLLLGNQLVLAAKENKFYLCTDREDFPEEQLHLSESQIIDRVIELINFLKDNQIKPKMIDICRSRLSGFTPPEQWQFIEHHLLQNLQDLYSLEIIYPQP